MTLPPSQAEAFHKFWKLSAADKKRIADRANYYRQIEQDSLRLGVKGAVSAALDRSFKMRTA